MNTNTHVSDYNVSDYNVFIKIDGCLMHYLYSLYDSDWVNWVKSTPVCSILLYKIHP